MAGDVGNIEQSPPVVEANGGSDKGLPKAKPGISLCAFVAQVAPILRPRLAQVRRSRRQAEWTKIQGDLEAAYGEPVALRTIQCYLAANRDVAPAVEPTPIPLPAAASVPPRSPAARSKRRGAPQSSVDPRRFHTAR